VWADPLRYEGERLRISGGGGDNAELEVVPQHPYNALETQVGGDHYRSMAIQPIEFIVGNNIPYREANVIKYVTRWRNKNGVEDLRKARHYIDMLIEEAVSGS
jgi:hypothetical protein